MDQAADPSTPQHGEIIPKILPVCVHWETQLVGEEGEHQRPKSIGIQNRRSLNRIE